MLSTTSVVATSSIIKSREIISIANIAVVSRERGPGFDRAFIKSSFPLFTGFHIHGNRVSWVTPPLPQPFTAPYIAR